MEYYNPYDGQFAEQYIRAANERKSIRRLSLYAGGAILLYILIQNAAAVLMQLFGVYAIYLNNPLVQAGAEIILSMIGFLVPFFVFRKPMRRVSGTLRDLPMDAPKNKGQFALAIPAGLGFCMLANQVTGYLTAFLEALGLELSAPQLPMPEGVLGVTASFFRIVAVAAVCEEVFFRGMILQNLRRYGEGFAILMSALVFGVMHCNLIQAPFALIVGVALGYFSLKTGTLWTGILIHACNNGISLVFSYLQGRVDDQMFNLAYLILTGVIFFCGTVCFILFIVRQKKLVPPRPAFSPLNSFGAKVGAYLSSPTMLISLGLMFFFTLQFVGVRR